LSGALPGEGTSFGGEAVADVAGVDPKSEFVSGIGWETL
jgi:hypothetical protein